jgi:hypothetical protein
MRKKKKNISDLHENFAAQILIEKHSMAGIRDEAEFNNIKYHCKHTLMFTKDLILNIKGTDKEKSDFIDKILLDLEKFKVK